MPRNSSAANPHEDVFLMIVFQSHLGHPSADTAIGSFPAGFEEPITGPAIAHVAVRSRSRRVIFKSYLKLKGVRGRAGAEDALTSISGPSLNPRNQVPADTEPAESSARLRSRRDARTSLSEHFSHGIDTDPPSGMTMTASGVVSIALPKQAFVLLSTIPSKCSRQATDRNA